MNTKTIPGRVLNQRVLVLLYGENRLSSFVLLYLKNDATWPNFDAEVPGALFWFDRDVEVNHGQPAYKNNTSKMLGLWYVNVSVI